jgi:tRNA (adenine22-N1)-methyltransferase
MKNPNLSGRLFSASEFVRQDAVFADVGTDHAYLPIFLLESGKIKRAVCSDINKGPLESAKRNASERGVCDKISFYLTDGAAALSGEGITDMAICGMGGELIADIIDAAPFLNSKDISLILQPMTKPAYLRRYLYSKGFEIKDEKYVTDTGKHYVTMLVFYTGGTHATSDAFSELGTLVEKESLNESERSYLEEKLRATERAVSGKKRGGEDCSYEESIYHIITDILKK